MGPFLSFLAQQGPARAPNGFQKGTQHGTQNATQNGPKSKTKTKTKKEAFQDRLGATLEPFWVDLEAHLGVKFALSPRAALVFLKKHFFDVKTVRRRLWDQLWPTKAPK